MLKIIYLIKYIHYYKTPIIYCLYSQGRFWILYLVLRSWNIMGTSDIRLHHFTLWCGHCVWRPGRAVLWLEWKMSPIVWGIEIFGPQLVGYTSLLCFFFDIKYFQSYAFFCQDNSRFLFCFNYYRVCWVSLQCNMHIYLVSYCIIIV